MQSIFLKLILIKHVIQGILMQSEFGLGLVDGLQNKLKDNYYDKEFAVFSFSDCQLRASSCSTRTKI